MNHLRWLIIFVSRSQFHISLPNFDYSLTYIHPSHFQENYCVPIARRIPADWLLSALVRYPIFGRVLSDGAGGERQRMRLQMKKSDDKGA